MSEEKLARGIIVPLPTVFEPDGEVDWQLMEQLVHFYLHAGVHAFFILGSIGQGPVMRLDQREAVAQRVLGLVDGRIPCIVHIGTADVQSAVSLAQHAQRHGATAVAAVPPYYYSDHSEYELVLHYQRIADAVSLPVVVYDNPRYSGIAMPPDRVARLKEAIPSIKGIKLSVMELDRALEYLYALPKDVAIWPASISYLLPGVPYGFDGIINPPTMHIPELTVALWDAVVDQDWPRAFELNGKVNAITRGVTRMWSQTQSRAVFGEALRLRGFDVKLFPRWPTQSLSPAQVAEFRAIHQEAGVELKAAVPSR